MRSGPAPPVAGVAAPADERGGVPEGASDSAPAVGRWARGPVAGSLGAAGEGVVDPDGDEGVSRRGSAEAVAAGAGAARVGVVDREALLLYGVGEVDRRAVEVGGAHPVDHDPDAAAQAQRLGVELEAARAELDAAFAEWEAATRVMEGTD